MTFVLLRLSSVGNRQYVNRAFGLIILASSEQRANNRCRVRRKFGIGPIGFVGGRGVLNIGECRAVLRKKIVFARNMSRSLLCTF